MPVRRFVLLGLVLFGLSACHTYRPVDRPVIGSTVRVHVPIDNALRSANQAPETATVEGRVVATGDTLALATQRRQEYGAYREVIQYDTLHVGMDRPTLLEVREFSSQKSVLLGVVIAAGATVAAVAAFNSGRDGGEGESPGGGGPEPAIVMTPSLVSMILGLFGN